MAIETVRVDLPIAFDAPASPAPVYTGIAVHEEGGWSSLCPELDIASMGGDADEAMDNLVQAVIEAIQLADEKGIPAGHATPPDAVRAFMISGNAPYYLRKFYA